MDLTDSGFINFAGAFLNETLAIFIIKDALIHSNYDSQVKLSLLLTKHLLDFRVEASSFSLLRLLSGTLRAYPSPLSTNT
jgi:hypothetical protein